MGGTEDKSRAGLDVTGKDTDNGAARDRIWRWYGLCGERLARAGADESAAGGRERLRLDVGHVEIEMSEVKVDGGLGCFGSLDALSALDAWMLDFKKSSKELLIKFMWVSIKTPSAFSRGGEGLIGVRENR